MWDPEVAELLATLNSGFPDVSTMAGAEARAMVSERRAPVTNLDDVAGTSDIEIPGDGRIIPARVYHPHGRSQDAPVIVFFHGGGFVFCDIETHDGFCRAASAGTSAVVVSVDYRLAPEHKAPAAAEDAFSALAWVANNAADIGGDGDRILVAGDSSGGNLAAVACLATRDHGGPRVTGQVLMYPVIDPGCDSTSFRRYATGYYNTAAAMRWYWKQYLPGGGDGAAVRPWHHVAPLAAPTLAGLPPAVVVTAGTDPLADEGHAYAAAMRRADVPVVHRCYGGLFHGFLTMMALRAGRSARELLWRDVNTLLTADNRVLRGATR